MCGACGRLQSCTLPHPQACAHLLAARTASSWPGRVAGSSCSSGAAAGDRHRAAAAPAARACPLHCRMAVMRRPLTSIAMAAGLRLGVWEGRARWERAACNDARWLNDATGERQTTG